MPESAAANWYPDPFRRHELRYWNGLQWTEHVSSGGFQDVDPPLDMNSAHGASPVSTGWHPDPLSRHEQRYWDGAQWTEHVYSRGTQGIDPLGARQAESPVTRGPSKKVARQVQMIGADSGESDGGTLFTEQVLVVNQKAKILRSRLEYSIFDQNGRQLGVIQELRRDLATKIGDSLRLRTAGTRAHRFRVVDLKDQVLLSLTRPEMGFFQMKGKLVVDGPGGAPIGQISRETLGLLRGARFGLEAGGQSIGSVRAESQTEWNFTVQDHRGSQVARITKTWAGWAKERFTKADNYVVQMHHALDEPLRSLVVAAALAIDIELKERGDQTSGYMFFGLGERRYN